MLVHLSEVTRDMTLASQASNQDSVLHMGRVFSMSPSHRVLNFLYLLSRASTVLFLPDDTLGPLLAVEHSSKLEPTCWAMLRYYNKQDP
jgi:hypothetical protein